MSGKAQAILQALSGVVERILAVPGAHGGLTEEYIEELAGVLAEYIEARFTGQFSVGERQEMARFVIIRQQAQRHAATAAVDVRARDNRLVKALAEDAANHALDEWRRRKHGCHWDPTSWSSAKDCELVSGLLDETDPRVVVAALRELRHRRMFHHMRAVQTYLELAEDLGREPHLWETASSADVTQQVVVDALLLFKNLLSESVR